jgi:hypothetical protein
VVRVVKATLGFDPNDYDYGPATAAIRSIIVEWAAVDWFEPSGAADADLIELFHEHNALGHDNASELFAEQVSVRVVSGGWSEFNSWCERVRDQTRWDWRFSILKKLGHEHSKAHGWSLDVQTPLVKAGEPKPGDMFFRYSDTTAVWNGFLPAPALRDLAQSCAVDSARFYFSHAQGDAFSSIEWQLAEKSDDLDGNPFLPLLGCYGAGGYPFSLDRDTVVIFRFEADGRVLPKATLLPSRNERVR